jgi:hypothetical protein
MDLLQGIKELKHSLFVFQKVDGRRVRSGDALRRFVYRQLTIAACEER